MKIHTVLALAGAVALLSACVPSVNPFYTEKDVVYDAHLLGEWRPKERTDDAENWKFEAGDNKAYKLTIFEEGGKEGRFEAKLVKLQQHYFLDLVPSDIDLGPKQAGIIEAALIPGHLIARVTQFEPSLKVAFFDADWLKKQLEAKPRALAHRKHDDRIIITAETRDFQRFALKHLRDGELFGDAGELLRKSNAGSTGTATPARQP